MRNPVKGDERFLGRLAIPYLGPKGNVYGMNYRCIQDHDCKEQGHRKYDKPSGLETRMFNTRALLADTDYLFVTEGEIDAISITACGWPAVGMAGASTWNARHARMVAGFTKVVLLADPDSAGEGMSQKFLRSLPSSGSVMMVVHGEARDVNDVLTKYGVEGMREFVRKASSDE